jgi:hypothetical protein
LQFKTSSYSVNYPSTWEVETDDPDYDPESYFCISGSPDASFLGSVPDHKFTPKELLDRLNKIYSNMMKVDRKEEFSSFGGVKGTGLVLYGSLESDQVAQGEVVFRVFTFAHKSKTHAIVCSYVSSETQMIADLKSMEASFKLAE